MKIALVHPFAWPEVRRGGERYVDDLAWYLRGAGHVVDVIAGTRQGASHTKGGTGDDIRLRHLPGLRRGGVAITDVETFGARALPRLLRRRYDIVHAFVPAAALAARLAGQRTVFTLLGHPTADLLAAKPAQARLLAAVLRHSSAVTALSGPVAGDVARLLGRRPVVIPPGVRMEGFAPTARAAVPTILFASAMRPEKGLDVLLRAFAAVAAETPTARLVLCGPGDPGWAFDAVGASFEPYRDRVDVVGAGAPGELPARFAAAHVTALPSRNEAFGLVLAESLASGTPVVGCRGGGADDIVTDGVGAIVAHGDPDALAAGLQEALGLAADAATASRCVARARAWDWRETIGPHHETLYRDVAEFHRV